MNEMPAVPWVSTQAGPTTSTAFLNAVYLSWPAIRRSRAANVSCIESEKLITMISGVITFRNMLRLKLAQPSAAEREQDRDHRRERGHHHERYLAEEDDRDDAAGQNAEDVVGQPVALDRVADFELHDRNAGQFGLEPAAFEIVGHQLPDIADRLAELVAGDHVGLERQHDQRQRAVFGQQLAADDLVAI